MSAGQHPRAGIVTLPKTAFPTDFMGHKEALGSRARQRFLRRAGQWSTLLERLLTSPR
jgi:hypothetical protein